MPAWQKKFMGDKVEEGEDLIHDGVQVMKKGQENDKQKALHNQGYVPRKCCRPSCLRRETAHGQFEPCPHCKQAVYCSPRCYKLDWDSHNYYKGDRNHSHKAVCSRDKFIAKRENEDHKISVKNLDKSKLILPCAVLNPVAHPGNISARRGSSTPRGSSGGYTPRGAVTPRGTLVQETLAIRRR